MNFERKTLAELIASELSGRIVRGELTPGERLPSERELAEVYGTNRNTLREALRILQMQGLLRVRHGSGAVVLDFRTDGHLTLMPQLLQSLGDPEERLREILDIGTFRRVMLSETAAMAADRATEEDVECLRDCLVDIEDAFGGDLLTSIRHDLEFYRLTADAAHSQVVRWTFNTFARMYEQALGVILVFWVFPEGYLESLRAVVDAIAERRPDDARERLRRHLERSDELLGRGSRATVRNGEGGGA